MKLCVLGSGSGGNCTLAYSDSSAVLVDAGFSCREIEKRLKTASFSPDKINAILISHEHSDHIKGAALFSRKYGVPAYLTEGTATASEGALEKGDFLRFIRPEEDFKVGDLEIHPFSVPHDAAEPVSYLISNNGRVAMIMTDLGHVTVRAVEKTRMANLVMVESNHDVELLKIGPYPFYLKQRVGGKLGHLSNDACMDLLANAGGAGLSTVIFAHLSRHNNNPNLVRLNADTFFSGSKVAFEIASQDVCGKTHEV
ncbi:MAG: MBL fold metallo-hydrolase [Nitrospinae bacterium]|nr:MBL fold metallo-hydrolase [Nitrospinota bacterium]